MAETPRVGREAVLLVTLVVVLAVAISLRSRGTQEDPHPGSTASALPEGCKALYLLFGRLGRPLARSTERIGDFGESRLAFLISPEEPLGHADLAGLRSWVERGGTLVYGYSADEPDSAPLRDVFGLRVRALSGAASAMLPRTMRLAAEFAPAREIAVPALSSVWATRDKPSFSPIADEEARGQGGRTRDSGGEATLAMLRVGDGRVIAVPAAALGNRLLAEADNAVFLAVLAERYAGQDPVVFEEWSHGFGGTTGVLNLARAPLLAAAALLSVAFVLYALAGRRLGPPSLEPPAPRRATIEQVGALARFYQKAGARGAVLAALGLPAQSPPRNDAELLRIARNAVAHRGG